MQNDIKVRLKTCDRFLKRIKNKPEYKQTYTLFKSIRTDLAKKLKKV